MPHPNRITPGTHDAGDGITFIIDPAGFPVEPCPRCSSQGEIPAYYRTHHGICYACNGAGYRHPKHKAGDIARDWYAAARINPISGKDMEPGMQVRPAALRGHEPRPWRTIASIRRTAKLSGWSVGPNGEMTTWSFEHVARFTDGSTVRMLSDSWETRADVDAIEARRLVDAEQACRLWAARLVRSAAAKARRAARQPAVAAAAVVDTTVMDAGEVDDDRDWLF